MIAKFVHNILNERAENFTKIEPAYFRLPYNIPDDRFENGLLKANVSRRTYNKRYVNDSIHKYANKEEFLKNVSLIEINAEIKASINRVLKFLRNNPYTGKTIKASYEPFFTLKEYLTRDPDDGECLGLFETNIPSMFSLMVNYDIYKNILVFTIAGDALFYYYELYTLEPNDVIGSGEDQSYITEEELYNGIFAETLWRASIKEIISSQNQQIIFKILGYKRKDINLIEDATELNNQYLHAKYVYDPNWIKLLRQYIIKGNVNFLSPPIIDPRDLTNKDSEWIKDNNKKLDGYYKGKWEWQWDEQLKKWTDVIERLDIWRKRGYELNDNADWEFQDLENKNSTWIKKNNTKAQYWRKYFWDENKWLRYGEYEVKHKDLVYNKERNNWEKKKTKTL